MKLLWLLLISVPFLVSLSGAFVVLLILIEKGPDAGMVGGFVLFTAIAAYLFRLIVKSFEPDGGIVSVHSGTDRVNLSWSGGEPGLFTYITFLLLGPLAFLLFNKGKLPNFPGPEQDLAARKKITGLFLLSTYLVIGIGAVILLGSADLSIWLIVGGFLLLLLISWLATIIGIFARMLNSHNVRTRS